MHIINKFIHINKKIHKREIIKYEITRISPQSALLKNVCFTVDFKVYSRKFNDLNVKVDYLVLNGQCLHHTAAILLSLSSGLNYAKLIIDDLFQNKSF